MASFVRVAAVLGMASVAMANPVPEPQVFQSAPTPSSSALSYNPGGPILFPTPPPSSSGTPTCTGYTVTATDTALNDGEFSSTSTVYTSTSYMYDWVDCGGCGLTTTTIGVPLGGPGPVKQVTTVTAATPLTLISTVCAPAASTVCTSTITVPASFDLSPTSTSYTGTVTTTVPVSCDSACASVDFTVSTRNNYGIGPEVRITTTVSALSTSTEYVCAAPTA